MNHLHSTPEFNNTPAALLAVGAAWLLAVLVGSQSGFFSALYQPLIGAIVGVSIVLPAVWYANSVKLRQFMAAIGQRRIMMLHTWRIPAALAFFWYGANGQLPPLFWMLASVGDLIAGSLALYLLFKPESAGRYWLFHSFGFLDFVVAVGTGLTYTLLQDARMAPVAVLPLALIPLFGVGISGATHLIAFDMLRRGVGMKIQADHNEATNPLPAR
jgi:hypothetical protein